MLQRGNGAQSSPTRQSLAGDLCKSGNGVDRATSALNRRILPECVDGRSAEAKRLVGLIHDLAARVQSPDDPITRVRLKSAALLLMQAETMAHAAAAGEKIDSDDLVRVVRAAEHALERLGL